VKNGFAARRITPGGVPLSVIGPYGHAWQALYRRGIKSVGDLLDILCKGDKGRAGFHNTLTLLQFLYLVKFCGRSALILSKVQG